MLTLGNRMEFGTVGKCVHYTVHLWVMFVYRTKCSIKARCTYERTQNLKEISRMRAWVEMTIGLLKAHFQCVRPLKDIIVACVVLQNIVIIRGEQHPEEDLILPADFQDRRVVQDVNSGEPHRTTEIRQ